MFHLDHDADTPPENPAVLRDAILGTLRNELTLDPKRGAVKLDDGNLVVDLTGARVATDVPPKTPRPAGEPRPGPTFGRLRIHAEPLHVDEAAATLRVDARDVSCVYDYDTDDGRWLLLIGGCRTGEVEAVVAQEDLRALLLAKMKEGAKPHGVAIESLDLKLTSAGPRSVALAAAVAGRKKLPIGSAAFAVDLSGRLDVDDALVARLSGLKLEGRGVVMKALVPLMEPKLREIERHALPLTALPLGSARLRDVTVEAGDAVRVHAVIGSGAEMVSDE